MAIQWSEEMKLVVLSISGNAIRDALPEDLERVGWVHETDSKTSTQSGIAYWQATASLLKKGLDEARDDLTRSEAESEARLVEVEFWKREHKKVLAERDEALASLQRMREAHPERFL